MKISTCLLSFAPLALTATSLAQLPALQADWIQSPINGNWYGVDYSLGLAADQEVLANSLGGHLATVRSQPEQDFINSDPRLLARSALDANGYGGLHFGALEVGGSWSWRSGEPWVYTNWGGSNPNNNGPIATIYLAHPFMCCGAWNDEDDFPYRPLIELPTEPQVGWSWPRDIDHDYSHKAVAFDLDGDGNLDAITTSNNYPAGGAGSVQVAWGDGSGNFTQTTQAFAGAYLHDVACIDVDLNGIQDIVACAATSTQKLYWIPNTGSRQFGPAVTLDSGTKFVAVGSGDLNKDGLPDLYATGVHFGDCLRVYMAQPSGGFGSPQVYSFEGGNYGSDPWPVDVAHGDLDSDGDLDIVVTLSNGGAVVIMTNDGSGGLTESAALSGGVFPSDFELADFDGDGDLDIVVPYYGSDEIHVFANDGSGTFSLLNQIAIAGSPWYCRGLDFNQDGALDLAVSQRTANSVTIFQNLGAGDLVPHEVFALSSGAGQLDVGQFDGRGAIDLLVAAESDGDPRVWLNLRSVEDCNANGVPDNQDIIDGTSSDCDGNGIPDECDIANDLSLDWNGDGVLDECSSPNYCTANSNSTGLPAVMSVSGSPIITDNNFTLTASQMPVFEWGYFLMGGSQGFIPNAGGSAGNLCLGSPIYRFNKYPTGTLLNSGPSGAFSFSPNLVNLPKGVVFQIGETWDFQAWYRDGAASTSNFTDGIEVMFR